jgi:hypothetical protein
MSDFKVEQGEYKGNKTISLIKDEKRVFSCGIKKAQAIIANFEAIKEFVEANIVEEVNE